MPKPIPKGISIAIPNKGRLSDGAVQLLDRAGLSTGDAGANRQLLAVAWQGRVRVLFVRAQDIPELVKDGLADLGITGLDLILEKGAKVKTLLDLKFGRCRLVAAVPEKRRVRTLGGLPRSFTVATSFPNLTTRFFRKMRRNVKIVPVSGATEVMPHIGVADVITDLTATGSTLAMNDLVEIANIQESTAQLIASPKSLKDRRKKPLIDDVHFAISSVVHARGKRYLMADVPTNRLAEVQTILPGIAGPTVMDIFGKKAIKAVHVVVDEEDVYEAMRRLKAIGAKGILVVPVDRMVH
ncbi:MAG TPA: ATP phosphoribosyltransferase [Candidatus Thermoplasmatota archaeon]|nr:ATP phosphoribosyltransferase [Candidatus Thermoplasmatota archaeon]